MSRRDREVNRRDREKKTVAAMVRLYCRARHGVANGLCADCADLLRYAMARLDACPFGEEKPACSHCTTHCYAPRRRGLIREVMRCAGPRMLPRHPVLAVAHLLDSRRTKKLRFQTGDGRDAD